MKRVRERGAVIASYFARQHQHQCAVRFHVAVDGAYKLLAQRIQGGGDGHGRHLQVVLFGIFADGHGNGIIPGQVAHQVVRPVGRAVQQQPFPGRHVYDHVGVFPVVHSLAQAECGQIALAALLRRGGDDDFCGFRQHAVILSLIQKIEQSPVGGGGKGCRRENQAGGHGNGRAQAQFAFHRSFLLLAQSAERVFHGGDKRRVRLSKGFAKVPLVHESPSSDSSCFSIVRPRRMRVLTVPCARRRAEAIS